MIVIAYTDAQWWFIFWSTLVLVALLLGMSYIIGTKTWRQSIDHASDIAMYYLVIMLLILGEKVHAGI